MDNKYGLGGTKVAVGHHESHHKQPVLHATHCKCCGGVHLILCPTICDHRCADCGELQCDIPLSYSSGRNSNLE